jgi:hypothetical protein
MMGGSLYCVAVCWTQPIAMLESRFCLGVIFRAVPRGFPSGR